MLHQLNPSKSDKGAWILLFTSFLITQFLFFIDEGYYDFRWMKSFGNWLVFVIYTTVIFAAQVLVSEILLKHYMRQGKLLISILTGTTVGLLILLLVIFG